jgi:hypothetical protein
MAPTGYDPSRLFNHSYQNSHLNETKMENTTTTQSTSSSSSLKGMNILPPEIINYIIQFIDKPLRFTLINKKWRNIIRYHTLKMYIYIYMERERQRGTCTRAETQENLFLAKHTHKKKELFAMYSANIHVSKKANKK